MAKPLRVALVHHWLASLSGGEQVLLELHRLYPKAPIYTSTYQPERLPEFAGADVRTSFMQKWPLARRKHQLYPWLRPLAFESFDFSEYDIVISSDSAEAKGIVTRPETIHICYCHTPIRYYWNDYHSYLSRMEFGILNPLVRRVMPYMTNYLRIWDYTAAQRVDFFLANSKTTQARIKKYYGKESEVIYPPVDVKAYKPQWEAGEYFLSVGRLIPYKRVDLAVRACTKFELPLKVAGEGPELERLKKIAGPTVEFLGRVPQRDLPKLYEGARAFIFASEEDFGIVPVEAMAAGVPVVAYGKGGVTESVIDGETGVFFDEQTEESLAAALEAFNPDSFDRKRIRSRAEEFSRERFDREIKDFVAKVTRGA